MAVTTQQLLPPDRGLRLPRAARRALIEMGTGCNQAAVLVHQQISFTMQVQCLLAAEQAGAPPGPVTAQVTADLSALADQHLDQAVVVLARAATRYAVYASRVAAAIAASGDPPLPDSEAIRPSDVIAAYGHYLPEIRFTADGGEPHVAREQNDAIAAARKQLVEMIAYQMQGEELLAYDEIAAVVATPASGPDTGRKVEFAQALHTYATVLVWAASVFSGAGPDNETRPA